MEKGDQKRLILLDIDGTMLRPGKGARAALTRAILEITGVNIKSINAL